MLTGDFKIDRIDQLKKELLLLGGDYSDRKKCIENQIKSLEQRLDRELSAFESSLSSHKQPAKKSRSSTKKDTTKQPAKSRSSAKKDTRKSRSRQSLGEARSARGSVKDRENLRKSNIETALLQLQEGRHGFSATHDAQRVVGGHKPTELLNFALSGDGALVMSTDGDENAPPGCYEKVRILDVQSFAGKLDYEDQVCVINKGKKNEKLKTKYARSQLLVGLREQGVKTVRGYTHNGYGGSNGITYVDVYHICLHSRRPSCLEDVKKITTKRCTKVGAGRTCGCVNNTHGC